MPGLSELLPEAPRDQRSLLELGVRWPTLPEAHARVAATLRVFVLNWDPLGWLGQAFEASATATGDGDDFELVLYAPVDDPPGLLEDRCRSVVDVGVSQELLLRSGAYAQLAFAGKAPDLLCAIGTLSVTGAPEFEAARGGWEPIGLGAIQDLVQARFGPVDLDRSAVALDGVAEPQPACPACAGRRLRFPAELADEQAAMCPAHARQAAEITAERLARAEASNRDGWRAIVDASSALDAPTWVCRSGSSAGSRRPSTVWSRRMSSFVLTPRRRWSLRTGSVAATPTSSAGPTTGWPATGWASCRGCWPNAA